MATRADITFAQTTGLVQFSGGGVQYIVQSITGALYMLYVDTGSDLAYRKSVDGGFSWGNPIIIHAGTITSFSVWYDRWSNISAGLIHIAHNDSGTDDTIYRTINTESSDALSTATVIQNALISSVAGGSISITRTRGGNVLVYSIIDAGAEGNFYRLINANVPNGAWDAAKGLPEASAAGDMMIMNPGFAADNQDAIGIFWDASANEVSRYLYDDSANTWSETSIATSMVEQVVTTAFPHFATAVDLTNSSIILVVWTAVDTASAILRCWEITDSSISALTDVVSSSTDDQGLCAININERDHWFAYYGGKTDGSETFLTSINIYCKGSTDGGATWGPETAMTTAAFDITWLITCPRYVGQDIFAYHKDIALDEVTVNVSLKQPSARYAIGI